MLILQYIKNEYSPCKIFNKWFLKNEIISIIIKFYDMSETLCPTSTDFGKMLVIEHFLIFQDQGRSIDTQELTKVRQQYKSWYSRRTMIGPGVLYPLHVKKNKIFEKQA